MGVPTEISGAKKKSFPSLNPEHFKGRAAPLSGDHRSGADGTDGRSTLQARLWLVVLWLGLLSTVTLLLLMLLMRTPAQPREVQPHNLRGPQSCSISLVESMPIGLEFNSTISHMTTYDAWKQLLVLANGSISIASYYWTMLGRDVVPDPSARQGEDIYLRLMESGLRDDVTLRIAEDLDSLKSNETRHLVDVGAAEVRALNFTRLVGAGILHTKMWLVDLTHFYVGSANMDFRSLTQVKELGALVRDCGALAADMDKIFQVYWLVGDNGSIPDVWPDQYHTNINVDNPLFVQLPNETATVYLSSSPPQLCPPGRTSDVDAIVHTIDAAQRFVYVAVMDYYPMIIYDQFTYWDIIDDALRRAAVDRRVEVRLLASFWNHTHSDMLHGLLSLDALDATRSHVTIQVRMFEVPPGPGQQIPFSRVNHNKYMVTDQVAYIGTSNWSGDYFVSTGGIGLVVNSSQSTDADTVRSQLEAVFLRDWNSDHTHPLADYL